MNKWNSRKFFVMILTNLIFTTMYIFTIVFQVSVDIVGPFLISGMAFFNAAYCGANVLDKWVQRGNK